MQDIQRFPAITWHQRSAQRLTSCIFITGSRPPALDNLCIVQALKLICCAELSSVPRGVLHVVVTALQEGAFRQAAQTAVQAASAALCSAGELTLTHD